MTPALHKLIYDLSSDDYHATPDTFSSSQLKDLLKNDRFFIRKHINKEIPREENDAFDVGTYFHTAILEPEKLKTECIVYPGKMRKGEQWEKFKKQNKGKAIITSNQHEQAMNMIEAVQNSPLSQEYLVGQSEVSLFIELQIYDGEIYAPYFGKKLTKQGWVDGPKKKMPGAYTVVIKVRADKLSRIYVSDLKSTSSNADSDESMHQVVKRYSYQLSAALYLDMFKLLVPSLREFWLIFASKQEKSCMPYEIEKQKIAVGRAQYMFALIRLAEMFKNKFECIERPGLIRVLPEEQHWLQEKETDLL